MTVNLDELNEKIVNEAKQILYEYGLCDSLKKFGQPQVTGSYLLKLMTWRDLDIYLETDTMSNDIFFEIGKEIAIKLNPFKMNYRNEFISQTPHLPKGLYWGVNTNLFNENWKIDIWAIDSQEVKQKQKVLEKIKNKIDHVKRQSILELKDQLHSHPKYRKTFFSIDIYDAVLNENIKNIKSFKEWLYIKKKIRL